MIACDDRAALKGVSHLENRQGLALTALYPYDMVEPTVRTDTVDFSTA